MSLDRSRRFRGRSLCWHGVLPLLAGLVAVACAPGFERVQSESRAKLYKLTPLGRKRLESRSEGFKDFASAVLKILEA